MADVIDFTEYRNRKLEDRMHEVQRNQERFAEIVASDSFRELRKHFTARFTHWCKHEPLPVTIPAGQRCAKCGRGETKAHRDAVAAIWGPDFPGGAA